MLKEMRKVNGVAVERLKYRFVLVFLLGAVPFGGCIALAPEAVSIRDTVMVFPASDAARELPNLRRCGTPLLENIDGTWTPDGPLSLVAAAAVRDTLGDVLHALSDAGVPASAEEYLLQMFGYEWAGRQLVLINGFHQIVLDTMVPTHHDWRRMSTVVCDSGYAGFMAVYDPATQTIIRWHFDAVVPRA